MPPAGSSPRPARLTRSAEFERVYRRGRSAQHRLLVLYRLDRPEDVRGAPEGSPSRLGITVSKRVGGAVVRNRIKRQLRDALSQCGALDPESDYVAVARPGLPDMVERQGFDALLEIVSGLAADLRPGRSRA